MTTQEMIDVLKAYQDGKKIQYRNDNTKEQWLDIPHPTWNFYTSEYRIKPEIEPRKFELIKEFPLSPSLKTIVEFKTEQDFNNGIHAVGAIPSLMLGDCTHYPEFWRELKEEVFNDNTDLKLVKVRMG